jgi:hypothetical protein
VGDLVIIYSVIAPLILVFGTFAFVVFWILYRNNPPRLSDSVLNSRGYFYPVAIRQIFISLYFMELSLAGLFFLVRDSNGDAACIGQATIMILTTILTALFHFSLDSRGRSCGGDLLVMFRKVALCSREESERDHQHVQCVNPTVLRSDVAVNIDNEHSLASHIIWIPRDSLGIAVSEMYQMNKYSKHLQASTEGAYMEANGNIVLLSGPPDQQN